MKRYGVHIQISGSQYIEVDVPNGEDPEEYANELTDFNKVENWSYEIYDVVEVDES